MKNVLLVAVVMLCSFSVFADPCSYLDRYQCRQESKFCQYQEEQEFAGECIPKKQFTGNSGYVTVCNNAVNSHRDAEIGCKFFKHMCDWVPGDYTPAGCSMKKSIMALIKH